MATAVVVHNPFASYTRGQVIIDAAAAASVLQEHGASVHKITLAEPKPATTTAATPTVAEAVATGVAAAEAALHPAAK